MSQRVVIGRALRLFCAGIFFMACLPAMAGQKFNASAISLPGEELMMCDLDGDGLTDLVLMNGHDLSIFYQDATLGFPREPQQTCRLDNHPCIVWTANLGRPAGSLLVMTSDGVNELSFTNRTGPPVLRQIIKQATIIPDDPASSNTLCLSMSVATGRDGPLLLVPAADGLQVWQQHDGWHQAQVIARAIDTGVRPSLINPGYTRSVDLDFSVADVNGDGREDLIIRRSDVVQSNLYSLYLQQTNGLFDPEPALTYADKVDPVSWLCWTDLNRDGKVDLIKGVWLNEPSFLPGIPSAKVMVSGFIADANGRLPAEPQLLFRKNDWLAALPVVDVDGDGFPDLMLGYAHLDNRDSLIKEVTAKQLDYSLRFYFYRPANQPGGGFQKEADFQRDVVIHLDRSDPPMSWVLPQNFLRCVKLGGDFNGDGKTDLLVRDHNDSISVYFFRSREKGFSPEPDARFNCPESIDEWRVADLNHDGISDLVVKLSNKKGFRIFLSQKNP
ncbi:MAG TPA: VCBS repeat-containing protein [Candidatus Acidoferrales bacterium]|nr:VCBS repeat-containing protein [Candidatus Acidoferrales bacterium]